MLDQEVPVPEHVVDGLHWKFMCTIPARRRGNGELMVHGSIRIRQAASPSQSDTRR